jgi:hypothetical protein
MADQLALPPHTEAAPAAEGATVYDAKADAAKLDAADPQDYGAATPPPPPEPEPAAGTDPGADAPPPPPPDPNDKAKASAREFIEVYDYGQAMGFSWYSEGEKAEKFQLESYPKERAIHHLARGLEKMGSPELPWWMALLLVLAVPAAANYMAAKEYRKAKEEQRAAEARERHRQRNPGPIPPDSITHNGATTPYQPPAPAPKPDAPAPTFTVVKASGAPCLQCGAPTKKGRKYCSQSCAGKARKKKV